MTTRSSDAGALRSKPRSRLRITLAILALVIVSCGSSDGDKTVRDSDSGGNGDSYIAVTKRESDVGSRSLPHLGDLESSMTRPDVVEGNIVGVSPDAGWVSIPDEEQEEGGPDTRRVAFDDDEAGFRTIAVELEISKVLVEGDTIRNAQLSSELVPGNVIRLRYFLQGDLSIGDAEAAILPLGRVVLPLSEVAPDSQDEPTPFKPAGGPDIIVAVGDDDSLAMPLALSDVQESVLGTVTTYSELVEALAK